jgi:GntR family transcriptional regulator / MocR family aminotransferase
MIAADAFEIGLHDGDRRGLAPIECENPPDAATKPRVAELIDDSEIHRHTRKAMLLYAGRRLMMAELLERRFWRAHPGHPTARRLAVWVKLTNAVNMDEMIGQPIAKGLKYGRAAPSPSPIAPSGATRLGFAGMNTNELDAATFWLRQALGAVTRTE